jgi:predicted acyl esterase
MRHKSFRTCGSARRIHRAFFLLFLAQSIAFSQGRDLLTPRLPTLQQYASQPRRCDVFIRVGADSLDATYYVPSSPPDSNGYPGMIFVHGYGGNKNWDTLNASSWAVTGYVSLCYSVRGHGNSSGGSTIMSFAERSDLAEVVRFLRGLPDIDPEKLGIQGGSQGGLHGLWAVADSLPVSAVSADVITPHWASDMFMNGAVRQTLLFILDMGTVRYAPLRDTLWELARSDNYDSLRTKFVAGRDLDTARLHASRIPCASFVKWQDHFFSAQDEIESFHLRTGPGRLYLGTGGHYSDDNQEELSFQWGLVADWLEYFVRGRQTGILARPPVAYAYSHLPLDPQGLLSWSHEEVDTWPPSGMSSMRLFFHADSTLSERLPDQPGDAVVVRNVWNTAYSSYQGYADGFSGPDFEAALPKQRVVFRTRPLPSDVRWLGAPLLRLALRSDAAVVPLHAQIFEEDSLGSKVFLNRVNFTARHWPPGSSTLVEIPGIAHAHRFSRGSRIRVELTNIDDENRDGWGNTPFIVPVFLTTEATVYLDPDRPSSIEFPILGDSPLAVTLAAFNAVSDPGAQRVIVTWSTFSENRIAGYSVERRADGTAEYDTIGFVSPSNGSTGSTRRDYVFYDSTVALNRYWYRIRETILDGASRLSDSVAVDVVTDVAASSRILSFRLEQNYPNPFNPTTKIQFTIVNRLLTIVNVYDLVGREVVTLVNEVKEPGTYTIQFDCSNLASGVYLYRLQAGNLVKTKRLIVLK